MRVSQLIAAGILVLVQASAVWAQDAIITIHRDTIFAKVLDKNDMFVYYSNPEKRNGDRKVISRKEVAQIIPDFYAVEVKKKTHFVSKTSFDRFFVSGKGGYSHLLSETSGLEGFQKDYYNELAGGIWYSLEAGWMFSENFGLGVLASRAQHSNSARVRDNVSGRQGILADDITLDYYGLNAVMLFGQKQSGSQFSINLGFGVNRYKNDHELFFPFRLSGTALGLHVGGTYEWSIGSGIRIPLYAGFRGFQIVNLDIQHVGDSQDPFVQIVQQSVASRLPIDLRRLELGAGLIFSF